ncbi:MAG: 5-oxoprolinase subunit PxpA [Cryomorphaceae bacterium]
MNLDLNCDMGEGLNNEHLLMPYITSCNIACGGHAGSVNTLDEVLALALKYNLKVGAHPSFPDRENFGRKVMIIPELELRESLTQQMLLFRERAALQNIPVYHVKPHGALYNLIAADEEKAALVVEVVQHVFEKAKIYVPFGSEIEKVALARGVEVVYEAFADRNYNEDLSLVSRALPNATITNADKVVAHVRSIFERYKVNTIEGNEREIKAQTFCVHGDNKNAVKILKALHREFL